MILISGKGLSLPLTTRRRSGMWYFIGGFAAGIVVGAVLMVLIFGAIANHFDSN